MADISSLTYVERLFTFQGHWDAHQTTARQLAAIGHVADRPPLEAQEEGSRCITCGAFVKKDLSIRALEYVGSASSEYKDSFANFKFHHTSCKRLQVRIPLDPQALFAGLHSNRIDELKRRFDRKAPLPVTRPARRVSQKSSLFNLPTELRLQIYSMILPSFDAVTKIVMLNSESPRVVTSMGYEKTGPRETWKANILATCRTVHEEAMDLLYSRTTFNFNSTKVMYLFLRNIGGMARQLVKSVDIHCGGREDAIGFALLASCEKLESIQIRLPRPMALFPRAPIWVVDGMSCLLALDGIQKVSFGPCKAFPSYMSDDKADAAIIRESLSRPKGAAAKITWVKQFLNDR